MIKFALRCDEAHEFEGWFRSNADYDAQAADGVLVCPVCGSAHVEKAIMAPAVARSSGEEGRARRLADITARMADIKAKARDYVERNFENVGARFPDEARRIHYGETERRGVYGEATIREARELIEEGISVAPMPPAADTKTVEKKAADKSATDETKPGESRKTTKSSAGETASADRSQRAARDRDKDGRGD